MSIHKEIKTVKKKCVYNYVYFTSLLNTIEDQKDFSNFLTTNIYFHQFCYFIFYPIDELKFKIMAELCTSYKHRKIVYTIISTKPARDKQQSIIITIGSIQPISILLSWHGNLCNILAQFNPRHSINFNQLVDTTKCRLPLTSN